MIVGGTFCCTKKKDSRGIEIASLVAVKLSWPLDSSPEDRGHQWERLDVTSILTVED
jgi:hypothetical protein